MKASIFHHLGSLFFIYTIEDIVNAQKILAVQKSPQLAIKFLIRLNLVQYEENRAFL